MWEKRVIEIVFGWLCSGFVTHSQNPEVHLCECTGIYSSISRNAIMQKLCMNEVMCPYLVKYLII